MKKSDILLIYPQDETTDFLQGIPDFLFERHGEGRFVYQRLGFSVKEHQECIHLIKKFSEDSLVIFLGHGRSDGLLGALNYERFEFINLDNFYVFEEKQVFFLSCRSKELLENKRIQGIGFGHLLSSPTELNDIILAREYSYLYSDLGVPDSAAITQFNDYIVRIVRSSLHDYIVQNLSLEALYLNLKIRMNKAIVLLINENDPMSVRNLANLLLKAKREIRLFS